MKKIAGVAVQIKRSRPADRTAIEQGNINSF
jgi:hypothetical protein